MKRDSTESGIDAMRSIGEYFVNVRDQHWTNWDNSSTILNNLFQVLPARQQWLIPFISINFAMVGILVVVVGEQMRSVGIGR